MGSGAPVTFFRDAALSRAVGSQSGRFWASLDLPRALPRSGQIRPEIPIRMGPGVVFLRATRP
eukprot:4906578-Pyramimonas_sp.AAC.1